MATRVAMMMVRSVCSPAVGTGMMLHPPRLVIPSPLLLRRRLRLLLALLDLLDLLIHLGFVLAAEILEAQQRVEAA